MAKEAQNASSNCGRLKGKAYKQLLFFLTLRGTNLGGGKKKLTFAQIEKTQGKRPEKKKETKSSGSPSERRIPDIAMPDATSGKIVDEVKKLKVLTPYVVASRFNVRLSVAKDFLEELEKKGVIHLISRSRNVRVYKTLD